MRRALIAISFVLGCARASSPPASATDHAQRAAEPRVRVFTATWCKACRVLEDALDKKHIAFTAIDVDANPTAWRAAHDETGSAVLPLTRIEARSSRAWVEGANVAAVEAILAWQPPTERWVIFAWYDGAVDSMRVDGASVTTVGSVSARTLSAAIRLASALRSTKTTVARIEFDGDAHEKEHRLFGFSDVPVPWTDERAQRLDVELMLDYAQHADDGFAEAAMEGATVSLAPYERAVVRLHEKKGPRWRIEHVHFVSGEGGPLLTSEAHLRSKLKLADGAWFDREKVSVGLRDAITEYREAGYMEAAYDVEYATARLFSWVDVELIVMITPGLRCTIDSVEVVGEGVDAEKIRAWIGLKPGEIARESRIVAAKEKIVAAHLASDVAIATERTAPGRLKLRFELHGASTKL